MAILELVTDPGTGLFFDLDRDETVIGRLPECEIVLAGERVSRRHARVVRRGAAYVVEDLGSRNGTAVNGSPIEYPRPLANGDEIVVDESRLVFHAVDPDRETHAERASTVWGTIVFDPAAHDLPAADPRAQLQAVMRLSLDLARSVSGDQVRLATLATSFRVFPGIRRGFVLMPDDAGELRIATRRRNTGDGDDTTTAGPVWRVCRRAFEERTAILFHEESDEIEFPPEDHAAENTILGFGGSRSLACAPLVGTEGRVHGVVQIDRRGCDSPFEMTDLELLCAVAALAGQAIENKLLHAERMRARLHEQELRLAADVQRLLVPAEAPVVEGFELFHYYEPARQVGGDYFDYVPLPGGRLAVAIGDVAGKDVSAALLMTRLSAAVRMGLDAEPDLAAATRWINRVVSLRATTMRFVTFLAAVLDPRSGEATFCVAGHVPPVVRRRDGSVEIVDHVSHGPPLGIVPDAAYESFRLPLAAGEAIVLCTDGLTDSRAEHSNDQFGLDGIRRTLAEVDGYASASAIGRSILKRVRALTGGNGASDDVCVLVIRRTAPPGDSSRREDRAFLAERAGAFD